MAKSHQALLFLSCYVLFLVLPWIPVSHCTKKSVGVARKEDIPYIKCQVCEKLASQLYQQVQARQAEISPKKISEYQIIEIAENVCNLKKQEADWILKIDILEKGDKLELVEQDSEGQCNSECKTIERACQEVLGYSDTDVAEYLFKDKPRLDSLVNYICKDLTKACRSKPPPVPKDRIPGEPFVAKSTKEAEMERLMKSMEGIPGAPGMKMYSREDLMNQNFGDEDAEDDDDDEAEDDDDDEDDDDEAEDDDDDEAAFPSKLGKILRDVDAKKYDWKEQITRGAMDLNQKLKGHANRVSNRIRQWWKGTKTNWKKNSNSGKVEL